MKKRLIDANAFREFLEVIRQDYREEDTLSSGFAACLIETVQDEYLALAPTVDAVEVVHGRWKKASETMPIYRCSVCGERNLFKNGNNVLSNYCPSCGADMRGNDNGKLGKV